MSEARGISGSPARTAGGRCRGGLGHGRALEPDAILLAARRQAPGSPTLARLGQPLRPLRLALPGQVGGQLDATTEPPATQRLLVHPTGRTIGGTRRRAMQHEEIPR